MSYIRLAVLALLFGAPVAAHAAEGTVRLYLQPLPSEAARLTFAIASIAVVAENGSEYPLKLSLSVVGPATANRQRLLASARIPTGAYAGVVVRLKQAAMKTANGDVALPVPDAARPIDIPFLLAGQRAVVVWMTLRPEGAPAGGFDFETGFSAVMPPRPIADVTAFISDSGSSTVTVLDKRLGQVVGVIDTCAEPSGMALDQRRRRLYLACVRDDEIQAIDVTAAQVIERVRLSPGDGPRELALTPDGRTLLSANSGSNSVTFLEAAPLARLDRLDVGAGAGAVLVNGAGNRAFVFNVLASSISVVDIPGRTVLTTIGTDAAPIRGQFDARGDRLFVIHGRSPYVTIVDAQRFATVSRMRIDSAAAAVAFDPRRNLVFVGSRQDDRVAVYDPNTFLPLDFMKTPGEVSCLTIDTETNSLFMVSPETRSVIIGSLADRTASREADVGEVPYWVAVMGEHRS